MDEEMKKGEFEYAKRIAANKFDEWNDVTGLFDKFSGYYYEILGVIEDAVDIGARIALGISTESDDGEKE